MSDIDAKREEIMSMTKAIVGRWGDTLALSLPDAIAHDAGLVEGESVEIEPISGGFSVRATSASGAARRDAQEAAAEMIAERRHFTLGDMSSKSWIEEGRRS